MVAWWVLTYKHLLGCVQESNPHIHPNSEGNPNDDNDGVGQLKESQKKEGQCMGNRAGHTVVINQI